MGRPSNFFVFADETGGHGLTGFNPDCPVFGLTCCVFRKDECIERACPALQQFKMLRSPFSFRHDRIT